MGNLHLFKTWEIINNTDTSCRGQYMMRLGGGGFSNGNAGWHAVLPLVTAADQTETGRYWSVKVKFDVTSSLWHARDSFIKIIFPYIDNKSKYKQGNPTVEAIYLYCN